MTRFVLSLLAGIALAAPAFADAPGDVKRARQALDRGENRAALDGLGKAISSGELTGAPLAEAHALRCQALAAGGALDPAEAEASAALALDAKSAAAYACQAAIAVRRHQFKEAVGLYDRAIGLGSKDPDVKADRAVAVAMSGKPEEAIKALDRVIADNGKAAPAKRAEWLTNRARLHAARGKADLALKDVEQALALAPEQDPARAERYFLKSRLHVDRREFAKAIDDLNQAITLDKDAPANRKMVLFATRGSAYASTGDFQRAIPDFSGAIGLAQDAPPTVAATLYANRARARAESGDRAGALADFATALKLAPDQADALAERGALYLRQGDVTKGMADLQAAARIAPNDPIVSSRLAWAYAEQGEYGKAVETATKTVAQRPRSALTYWERGLFRFYQGQFADAAADFEKAVELAPSNPYAVLFAHIARGRADRAKPEVFGRRAAGLDLSRWPGPIVKLYLGEAQPAAVLDAAVAEAASAANRLAEANFYIGEWYMLLGQPQSAREMFNRVVGGEGKELVEYAAARTELKRIGG